MDDLSILKHLISIEQRAQLLLSETHAEFDRRMAAVKKEAEAKFEKDYEGRAAELERKLAEEKARIEEGYKAEIAGYLQSLEALPADEDGFKSAVKALLLPRG
jgi:hypothetical protein